MHVQIKGDKAENIHLTGNLRGDGRVQVRVPRNVGLVEVLKMNRRGRGGRCLQMHVRMHNWDADDEYGFVPIPGANHFVVTQKGPGYFRALIPVSRFVPSTDFKTLQVTAD